MRNVEGGKISTLILLVDLYASRRLVLDHPWFTACRGWKRGFRPLDQFLSTYPGDISPIPRGCSTPHTALSTMAPC